MALETIFEKNSRALAESFDAALQQALKMYEGLRLAGEKGKLSHAYISFLSSGVSCRSPWLRLDLYDERDRDDLTECFAYWDVPQIAEKLYADAALAAKEAGIREEYRLEQAWLDSMDVYASAFGRILPQIIGQSKSAQAAKCRWYFGQYLGNAALVHDGGGKQDGLL